MTSWLQKMWHLTSEYSIVCEDAVSMLGLSPPSEVQLLAYKHHCKVLRSLAGDAGANHIEHGVSSQTYSDQNS
jgi:hypothetical protein